MMADFESRGGVLMCCDPTLCVYIWTVEELRKRGVGIPSVVPGTEIGLRVTYHVDDLLTGGPGEAQDWFQREMETRYGVDLVERDNFTYVGVQFRSVKNSAGVWSAVHMSTSLYVKAVAPPVILKEGEGDRIPLSGLAGKELERDGRAITPFELKNARRVLGCLSWAAQRTAPGLVAGCSMLASSCTRPGAGEGALRDLRAFWRRSQKDDLVVSIMLRGDVSVPRVLALTDASISYSGTDADAEDMHEIGTSVRAQGGYVVIILPESALDEIVENAPNGMLRGGKSLEKKCVDNVPISLIAWGSAKPKRKTGSSFGAELQCLKSGVASATDCELVRIGASHVFKTRREVTERRQQIVAVSAGDNYGTIGPLQKLWANGNPMDARTTLTRAKTSDPRLASIFEELMEDCRERKTRLAWIRGSANISDCTSRKDQHSLSGVSMPQDAPLDGSCSDEWSTWHWSADKPPTGSALALPAE
jgi:hypothetical protein